MSYRLYSAPRITVYREGRTTAPGSPGSISSLFFVNFFSDFLLFFLLPGNRRMLEKIGLPAKPSMRGGSWVVDASHCQGCSSQFTFINRKHHCRRCGGIFCNGCTQQRMILRGQGDSPVRICDPCKKIEEAARFEARHGHKNRAVKGSSKLTPKHEDEILNQLLEIDGKRPSSSSRESHIDSVSDQLGATSSSTDSNFQEESKILDGVEDIIRDASTDVLNDMVNGGVGSNSPEELRRQAVEEKKKYKVLKGEGKSEEALLAFKRGKELERQAGALEIALRKSRRLASTQKRSEDPEEVGDRKKLLSRASKPEKDDLASELRELGWSDADLHNAEKNPGKLSLEGELSGLIKETRQKPHVGQEARGTDKTQVLAHKKKALMLKREGKLAEAKEELKQAKILEKQLEEQELLAEAEDSDDELSALIRSMDDDKQDEPSLDHIHGPAINFGHLTALEDDFAFDQSLDVTDDDLKDPEIASALKSFGWSEEDEPSEEDILQHIPMDHDKLTREVISLKREAVSQKQAGNLAEAMSLLKKAKQLEKDLESLQVNAQKYEPDSARKSSVEHFSGKSTSSTIPGEESAATVTDHEFKQPPKSKMVIQRELLALKKKALALRREGCTEEAEEELRKGKVLERQLEEMENAPKIAEGSGTGKKNLQAVRSRQDASVTLDLQEEGEDAEVTEQDMKDPALLSILENFGWKEDVESKHDNDSSPVLSKPVRTRSKAEIQRELLGIKRKALALRRQGKTEEADEELRKAKDQENQLAELEAGHASEHAEMVYDVSSSSTPEKKPEGTETRMYVSKGDGDREDSNSLSMGGSTSEMMNDQPKHGKGPPIPVRAERSKAEIQKELLGIKRKDLTLRRQGKVEEAEEELRKGKDLENQLAEMEVDQPSNLTESRPDDFTSLFPDGKPEAAQIIPKGDGDILSLFPGMVPEDELRLEVSGGDPKKGVYPIKNHPASSASSIPDVFGLEPHAKADVQSLAEQNPAAAENIVPQSIQSVNLMDLLTGDRSKDLPIPHPMHERNPHSYSSSPGDYEVKLDATPCSKDHAIGGSKHYDRLSDHHVAEESVTVSPEQNRSPADEANLAHGFDSVKDQVLALKRKALALKREGKMAEAREELRQAKLLEKKLEGDGLQTNVDSRGASASTSATHSIKQENVPENTAKQQKPMSGRDRFKLQQESLAHKRQALKLRREGKVEESEAEFELAKKLEAQIEEIDGHNSSSNKHTNKADDNAAVEDFLDPQLMSALKAIGWNEADMGTFAPPKPEAKTDAVKLSPQKPEAKTSSVTHLPPKPEARKETGKNTSTTSQRADIEEQVKAEKLRALNLKRAGNQAEALEALRSAKRLEKKLASLAS